LVPSDEMGGQGRGRGPSRPGMLTSSSHVVSRPLRGVRLFAILQGRVLEVTAWRRKVLVRGIKSLCEFTPNQRREVLVRGGNFSEPSRRGGPSRARRKLLGRPAERNSSERFLVRGGNFSEGLLVRGENSSEGQLEGTSRKGFSCEEETSRKTFSCEAESTQARRKEVVRTSLLRETLQEWKNNLNK
jgi:hypothetical protein